VVRAKAATEDAIRLLQQSGVTGRIIPLIRHGLVVDEVFNELMKANTTCWPSAVITSPGRAAGWASCWRSAGELTACALLGVNWLKSCQDDPLRYFRILWFFGRTLLTVVLWDLPACAWVCAAGRSAPVPGG
jgi:hypothetical protein